MTEHRDADQMTPEQKEWADAYVGKGVRLAKSGRTSIVVSYREGSHHGGVWFMTRSGKEAFIGYPARLQSKIIRGRRVL